MADGLELRAEVRGARAVARAAQKLPADARRELRDGTRLLARRFARLVATAGRADSRQSARAAKTVRASVAGGIPAVVAGPHPLLFGSEFGATRRFGWYAKGRYYDAPNKQWRRHQRRGSYWFFQTIEREQGEIAAAHEAMVRAVVEAWDA